MLTRELIKLGLSIEKASELETILSSIHLKLRAESDFLEEASVEELLITLRDYGT